MEKRNARPTPKSRQAAAGSGPAAGAKRAQPQHRTRSLERDLADLRCRQKECADLAAIGALLGWDRATFMPKGGASARSRQSATLARIAHAKRTDAELGRLLDRLWKELEGRDTSDDDRAMVRVARRDFARAIRITDTLAGAIAEHAGAAYDAWVRARASNDFASVVPHLERGVALGRALSEALGPSRHVMDPLIELAEPGLDAASVTALFDALKAPLKSVLSRAAACKETHKACLSASFNEAKQFAFALRIAEHCGYDLSRGRLDQSPHPFSTTFASGDVRITTRIAPNRLTDCLYATLHEAGHAIYEQSIADAYDGTCLGGGVSSGVHESQARLMENVVGRSAEFLGYMYPLLLKQFPEQLRHVPLATFSRAVNRVGPSLIRTDADEVTYNFHIMIRFDLECALLEGRLEAADLPAAWAERYSSDLGVAPASHAEGCLQDVHWFSGPIGGGFQGYTIGNVLASQFYAAALRAHPALPAEIGRGQLGHLTDWLATNVHRHGRKYDPADLVERATGEPMSPAAYIAYLENKYAADPGADA